MSRIGKLPVHFEKDVQVSLGAGNLVTVKGPKVTLSYKLNPSIKPKVDPGVLTLTRTSENKDVGYKANVVGRKLELNLGYTHQIDFDIPSGIEIKVEKNTKVIVSGADRNIVGLVAAKIRGFKEPEPYQGKGVKYDTETIRRKAGKSVSK
jgi:large subunit ribosomal protein L6